MRDFVLKLPGLDPIDNIWSYAAIHCEPEVLGRVPVGEPPDLFKALQETQRNKQVIVIEQHVPEDGLASCTKEIAWEAAAACDLHTFTIKDEPTHNCSHDDLLVAHSISVAKILAAVS